MALLGVYLLQKTVFAATKTITYGPIGYDIADKTAAGGYSPVKTQDSSPTEMTFNSDGTKMYTIGTVTDNVHEYSLLTAFDISTASFTQSFSVGTQESIPTDVKFNDDGSSMYVVGQSSDSVHQYDLSSNYDVSTASFTQSFSVAAQELTSNGMAFNDTGTKMYVIGGTGDDINEYNLSTPYDISTASYLQVFSVSTQDTNPQSVSFNSDGTEMYIVGTTNDIVHEYTLASAYNVSTARPSSVSVSSQDSSPNGVVYNDDGTKMFMVGSTNDRVYEYNLSTAYNATTATYSQSFLVSANDGVPQGIAFNGDGTKMYMAGSNSDRINEYSLSTGFDVSTATYVQNFSINPQDTNTTGVTFNGDGTKMYMVGSTNDRVYEYDLSTGFDVSTAVYLQNFSVATQETAPNDIAFNSDGTKMYIIGSTSDNVVQYNLSSAYDVSTAVYSQSRSISTQDVTAQGVVFSPDGTIMLMVGNTNDRVYQYRLSSGFDISTAKTAVFSVAAQETNPNGVTFNTDGSKMYVTGSIGDDINEYDLSINFDVNTATYVQNFSLVAQNANSRGAVLSSDGTKMFTIDNTTDKVIRYDLSTPYDSSTATPVQNLLISSKDTFASGLAFNSAGTKLYIIGTSSDSVHQYNLSSAYNLSTASFSQSFSVAAEETSPSDVVISSDGTKLFMIGQGYDQVVRYDLSSPYNVSSATITQSMDISPQESFATGLAFNANGSRMYVIGTMTDEVHAYVLTTNYDLNTASYNDSSSVAVEDTIPQSATFANNGKNMYVMGGISEDILEYSTVDTTANGFSENTADDGSVAGQLTFSLQEDSFQDTDNDDVLDVGSEVTVGNIPPGLTANITLSMGDTVGTLTLTGNATNHEDEDDVADITFNFSNSAFTGGNAASVIGATGPASSGSGIDFSDTIFIDTSRVSVDSNGAESDSLNTAPSISSDGRYITYASSSTNLVAGDTNFADDIFLYDTVTEITKRISVDSGGNQGNSWSYEPSISGDGRYVTYASDADNLVAGDTNVTTDVFLYDTVTEITIRVSVDSFGNEADGYSNIPNISSNGEYITYGSDATNLVPGDTNFTADIFLYYIDTQETARISVDSGGTEGNGYSFYSAISGDNRYTVYQSDADNLVAGDTNIATDIFLYDLVNETTTRVSLDSGGGQTNGSSLYPSISSDGRYIAYQSEANDIVAGDSNLSQDIFLFDNMSQTTTLVSKDSNGIISNNYSENPVVSGDGKYVAYTSYGDNLVSNDTNTTYDVFAFEVDTAKTFRVSVDSDRNQGDNGSAGPAINDDGKYIVYQSDAANLVTADSNGATDIFLASMKTANRLNYIAGSHGSVNGNTAQTVLYGLNGTAVTAVADSGYHFVGWSDNSTQNPRTDTNVVANISVTATFAANDSGSSSGGSSSSSSSGSSTEGTTSSPTPDTDSIPNDIEDAAPNDGDANDDGTKDSLQNNVASFINKVTDSYSVLEVPESCIIQSVLVGAESRNEVQDQNAAYPLGLMNFTVKCESAGQTVPIKQYYYTKTNADDLVMRKYNAAMQTYQDLPSATLYQTSIKDKDVVKGQYSIVEGGDLDEDGLTNKIIVDPSGPAREKTNQTIKDKKEREERSNNYLVFILIGILSAVSIALFVYLYRRNKKAKQKTDQ